MKTSALNTGLLVVDVQQAFENVIWGERNNPSAENNIAELIAAWRQSAITALVIGGEEFATVLESTTVLERMS